MERGPAGVAVGAEVVWGLTLSLLMNFVSPHEQDRWEEVGVELEVVVRGGRRRHCLDPEKRILRLGKGVDTYAAAPAHSCWTGLDSEIGEG